MNTKSLSEYVNNVDKDIDDEYGSVETIEVSLYYDSNTTRSPIKQPYLKSLNKIMLEQLYYYAYRPKLNLDTICEISPPVDKNILKQIILKFVDSRRFRFKPEELLIYTRGELCQILQKLRYDVEVLKIIPERSQEVILQPGGKTYLKYLGEPERFSTSKVENIPETYKVYYQNCSDITKTKEDILYDAIELGLSNQIDRGMTKEDLCRMILNYLSKSQYQM